MATVAPMIEPPTTSPTAAKMQTPTKYTAGPKLRRIDRPNKAIANATTPTIAFTPGVSAPSCVSAAVSGPTLPVKATRSSASAAVAIRPSRAMVTMASVVASAFLENAEWIDSACMERSPMSRLSRDSKTTLHFLARPLQDLTLAPVERHLHSRIADVAQVETRIDRGCLDALQALERLLAN